MCCAHPGVGRTWLGKPELTTLRAKGWIEPGEGLRLSAVGQAKRKEIENGTDELAAAPYKALGESGCADLRALARPWSRTFSELLF